MEEHLETERDSENDKKEGSGKGQKMCALEERNISPPSERRLARKKECRKTKQPRKLY